MNAASLQFLSFGLVVALLYNMSRRVPWRQAVLLIANLCFLATFATAVSAWMPYVAFLGLGYLCYVLSYRKVRGALPLGVLAVLLVFFWLKKYTFLPSTLFLQSLYVMLGLSYVLFRILHLLIDTSEDVITDFIGPVTFLNYTLNFTAIISGPIQRYQDYAHDQLNETWRGLDIFDIGYSIERIVRGYLKISVLGFLIQSLQNRYLADLPTSAHQSLQERVVSGIIIGASYPLYLYCNFSGYVDIVIGVATWIRLRLPENFNRPFTATNFLDFWGQWHITLSMWLRTYVYSPLLVTLMRRFQNPVIAPYLGVFAYFVTFFLIGVWHGRTSVFVAFGLLQGAGVSLCKLYQLQMAKWLGKKRYKQLATSPLYNSLARGLTFTYFAFSLIWFWSNWRQMASIVQALRPGALVLSWLLVFLLASLLLSLYEVLREKVLAIDFRGKTVVLSRYTRVVWSTAMVTVIFVLLKVLSVPTPEIVYKAF